MVHPSARHQEAVAFAADVIVLLADHDVMVVLVAIVLEPYDVAVAAVALVHRPGMREGVVDDGYDSEPSEPCNQLTGEALESEPWNDMSNQEIFDKGKLTSVVKVTTISTATVKVLRMLYSFIRE